MLNNNLNAEIDKTVYSTSEKVVGTWIDGKPLYQKTYSVTTTSDIILTGINIDKIFLCDTSFVKVTEGYVFPFSYGSSTTVMNAFFLSVSNVYRIRFEVSANYVANNIVVTIKYTKTTD